MPAATLLSLAGLRRRRVFHLEIIKFAVNPDHGHISFKYPPKYSLSFIA